MEALYEQRLAEGRQRYPAGFRLVAQPVGGADHGAPADWVILAPDESVWVPIGDDLAVPGRFVIDRGSIRLDVDYTSGRPVVDCTIRDIGRQQLRRWRYDELLDFGAATLARTLVPRPIPEPAEWLEWLESLPDDMRAEFRRRQAEGGARSTWEAGEQIDRSLVIPAVRRSRRARISEDDLQRAADAYRAHGIPGVKGALHVNDRQAWRYVRRAQEAGLLERQRAPRRRQEGTTKDG